MLSKSEILKAKEEALELEKRLNKLISDYLDEYSQKTLADSIGKSEAWISQATNPLHQSSFYIVHLPFLRRLLGDELIREIIKPLDSFLVDNPQVEEFTQGNFESFSRVLSKFAELTKDIADAFQDRKITLKEAEIILAEWENLKSLGEAYTCSLEKRARGEK